MDLGARPLKIFFVITLPLIALRLLPASSWALPLSLDDLVITSFPVRPGFIALPQVIFSKIKLGLDPQMNVLATILDRYHRYAGDCRQLLDDASGNQTGTRGCRSLPPEKLAAEKAA